ncbi:kxDL motif-containing protein 1 [Canna indica]|uniref:KxDL motif-containing protein 1 n=1 Tax=Canna indica TaxID=4628 RepID=A0AAQ3Q7R2_9LILI|nr:kxDL motif-containing protein 1 [Canna indica]
MATRVGEMELEERECIRAASEDISRQFRTLVNAEEVESIKQLQHLILGRLQDSNAVLSHFNDYSERCYAEVSTDFTRNVRLLKSMKSDLDHIFMKLRNMKAKLKATYPDAFDDGSSTSMIDQRPDLETPL